MDMNTHHNPSSNENEPSEWDPTIPAPKVAYKLYLHLINDNSLGHATSNSDEELGPLHQDNEQFIPGIKREDTHGDLPHSDRATQSQQAPNTGEGLEPLRQSDHQHSPDIKKENENEDQLLSNQDSEMQHQCFSCNEPVSVQFSCEQCMAAFCKFECLRIHERTTNFHDRVHRCEFCREKQGSATALRYHRC